MGKEEEKRKWKNNEGDKKGNEDTGRKMKKIKSKGEKS